MTVRLNDIYGRFDSAARARIDARTAALMDEDMTLRALREAHALTQVDVAAALGVQQENVSRIERRADLLLSTLSGYVAAMGGRLRLIAEFPDRQPVTIRTLETIGNLPQGKQRGTARKRSPKAA